MVELKVCGWGASARGSGERSEPAAGRPRKQQAPKAPSRIASVLYLASIFNFWAIFCNLCMPCQNCKEESVIYLIYMIFCCCLFFLQSFLLCLFFSKTVLSWPWFTSVLIAEIKISPKLFCHFPSLSTTQQRRPSGEAFVLFTTIVAALLLLYVFWHFSWKLLECPVRYISQCIQSLSLST